MHSVLQEASPAQPGPRSQEPFASCWISSLKPSEALPPRLPLGPLLSLPFPALLDPESNDTCEEILAPRLASFLVHFIGLKGTGRK